MERSFEEAFFIHMYYCCYDEKIEALIKWMKNLEEKHFTMVDIKEVLDIDDTLEALLTCLVLMFGAYGVNPEHGWVDDVDGAIAYLESMREHWDHKYEYGED